VGRCWSTRSTASSARWNAARRRRVHPARRQSASGGTAELARHLAMPQRPVAHLWAGRRGRGWPPSVGVGVVVDRDLGQETITEEPAVKFVVIAAGQEGWPRSWFCGSRERGAQRQTEFDRLPVPRTGRRASPRSSLELPENQPFDSPRVLYTCWTRPKCGGLGASCIGLNRRGAPGSTGIPSGRRLGPNRHAGGGASHAHRSARSLVRGFRLGNWFQSP
jgi:hypothetical protein